MKYRMNEKLVKQALKANPKKGAFFEKPENSFQI